MNNICANKLEHYKHLIKNIATDISVHLEDQKLKELFYNCFINIVKKTVSSNEDNTFMITGDIHTVWLRDSTFKIEHYLPFVNNYPKLKDIFTSLINRQVKQIMIDTYANTFNKQPNGQKWDTDLTKDNSWV